MVSYDNTLFNKTGQQFTLQEFVPWANRFSKRGYQLAPSVSRPNRLDPPRTILALQKYEKLSGTQKKSVMNNCNYK